MKTTHKLLACTLAGLVLTMGPALPAFAQKTGTTTTTTAAPAGEIDFGDDSSEWNKDGECDDPRFQGTGAAAELIDADLKKDATDCRTAYEAGTVTLKDTVGTAPADIAIATPIDAIDFGDDSSEWNKDGECDDPRFEGTGAASELVDADLKKDATDCKAAYEAGTITLKDTSTTPVATADINFGDDTSQWAKDGECDDPRFTGTGSAGELLEEDSMHDATDCKAAFTAGTVTLKSGDTPVAVANTGDIVFGDDTSEYANDSECDDPRFEGTGVAGEPTSDNRMHDATDCKAAVEAGTATMKTGETNEPNKFEYGTDNSRYANDGECDDKRFTGEGMDKKLLEEDVSGDATDCRTLVDAGKLSIIPVYDPAYLAGAPYDSKGINFGDNTSDYANDDQCDDPRFQGPGAAETLLDTDLRHDRDDCKKAYEAGTVILID